MEKQSFRKIKGKTWNNLLPVAKTMRKEQTPAELLLWENIRKKKLGNHFRRQHPIDCWIVDFVCLSKKLILEVDGGIHHEKTKQDEERDAMLTALNFRVVRYTNHEVIYHMESVLEKIRQELLK